MSDVVERAKAALESVQPGDWEVEEDRDMLSGTVSYTLPYIERFREYHNNVYCGSDGALARFIAEAHNALIPELVSEVEKRRASETRIRTLHRPVTIEVITCGEDCEHEDESDCPRADIEVCNHCYGAALEVDEYYGEHGITKDVAHPCPTIASFDAEVSS